MIDSGPKHPENRIHLFDPVGLINDGYGGYKSSNYAGRPRSRPTKSYGNFEEVNANEGLRSNDIFTNSSSDVGGLRSYDSFTIDANSEGLRSYDSFNMENNGGVVRSNDHNIEDRNLGGLRFGVEKDEEEESDASTPRLWRPSSPTSPKAKPLNSPSFHPTSPNHPTSPKSLNNSSPLHLASPKSMNSSPMHPSSPKSVNSPLLHNHHYHQNMSPSSRTQAIANGRRELMNMVRDLPESFYELSLKDIVEQKAEMEEVHKEVVDQPEEKKIIIRETTKETKMQKKGSKRVKKSESKKKMVRCRSVDNGRFLLRTSVFPIFSGSKKNKKNMGGSNSFKIAPMPKPASTGSLKGAEKDWWRRKSCISTESEDSNGLTSKSTSSGSSSSSSRSNSLNAIARRTTIFLPGCCLFNGRRIRTKK